MRISANRCKSSGILILSVLLLSSCSWLSIHKKLGELEYTISGNSKSVTVYDTNSIIIRPDDPVCQLELVPGQVTYYNDAGPVIIDDLLARMYLEFMTDDVALRLKAISDTSFFMVGQKYNFSRRDSVEHHWSRIDLYDEMFFVCPERDGREYVFDPDLSWCRFDLPGGGCNVSVQFELKATNINSQESQLITGNVNMYNGIKNYDKFKTLLKRNVDE